MSRETYKSPPWPSHSDLETLDKEMERRRRGDLTELSKQLDWVAEKRELCYREISEVFMSINRRPLEKDWAAHAQVETQQT